MNTQLVRRSADEQPRSRWRLPRRLGVLSTLAGVLSALVVAVAPSAAQAAYGCNNVPQGDYNFFLNNSYDDIEDAYKTHLVVFYLKSWSPTFNVADSVTDGNDSDSPQTKTFNISRSQTYTVQELFKVTASQQVEFLKTKLSQSYEYSQQLTQSYTTSNSITYTETLAPHTARRVYNGVDAINGIFDVHYWVYDGPGRCFWRPTWAQIDVQRNVPTTRERRDVKQMPTINPDGIVDFVNQDGNIRPCEALAAFGNGFQAPNRVILRQGGRTWAIGGGSSAWFESPGQINFTMPCDVTPNDYVSVSVESNLTVERGETLWPRFVFITP